MENQINKSPGRVWKFDPADILDINDPSPELVDYLRSLSEADLMDWCEEYDESRPEFIKMLQDRFSQIDLTTYERIA